ncbi:hypothetical protein RND81_12G087700 [Saponaria officinalis]|uniref:DRBM domain-containing protein n=1 Tax=Saponaria officinalis TaxID=3572 RepID=A0AAW1H8A1_SAPOF
MGSMELSVEEVGPTEETVLALLEFLVDPLLPSKCLSMEPPSQEHLVAKQVHAVVLLYNYYHRKHNPGLEFLEFISFCKLATGLKSSLLPYFPFMQRSDYGNIELDDLYKQMSLTEKAVMNACDISRSLDASNGEIVIESWPISKVAVFLVDSKKEDCFLFHSSVTQGVWSVIEKEVTLPGEESANKKKRVIKKTPKENQIDEASLQQAAYLAVKEACAFNPSDLKILGTHTVHSTSKAKAAVRLYIMQCKQSKQDESLVPIADALGSLQGPLVRKESESWLVTAVVEYFHLLPFVDKVSDWLSRSSEIDDNDTHVETAEDGCCQNSNLDAEESPNISLTFEEVKDVDNYNSSHSNEKLVVNTPGISGTAEEARNSDNHQTKEKVIPNSLEHREPAQTVGNGSSCQSTQIIPPSVSPLVEPAKDVRNGKTSNSKKEMPKAVNDNVRSGQKDAPTEPMVYKKRNRPQKNSTTNYQGSKNSNATKENLPSNMDIHEPYRSCSNGSPNSTDDQKQIIVAQEPDQLASNGGAIVVAEDPDTSSHRDNADKVYSDQYEKQDGAIVSFDTSLEYLQKIHLAITSQEDLISQTALKVLIRKRERLNQQLRFIGDEIALCDRNIDVIVKGGEDDLAVKINSMLEGCNDLCLRSNASESTTGLHLKDPDLPPQTKRKRLSDANLSSHDPCRELDSICNDNIWSLPTYNISTLEGGFKASVTVKGVDFECSSEGTVAPTPQDARNAAALQMLAKLQNMQCKFSSEREISPENAMIA